jgi:hypothetical protein
MLTFNFKNTTIDTILHDKTGIAFAPDTYVTIDRDDIGKLDDEQMEAWLDDGTMIFNDGVEDLDNIKAKRYICPIGEASKYPIDTTNELSNNLQDALLDQVTVDLPNKDITVNEFTSRMYPNLQVADDTTIVVGGTLIII